MAALTVRLVGIFGLVLRDYTWAQAIGTYCLYNQIAASYVSSAPRTTTMASSPWGRAVTARGAVVTRAACLPL